MFEFFISRRYLRSKHKTNLISIISTISAIGVTIGVAALIVVISVFNGFGSLVKSILINFDPHVTVHTGVAEKRMNEEIWSYFADNKSVENYYKFAEGKVLLQNGQNYEAVTLKGIQEQDSTGEWGIKTSLLKGEIDFNNTDKSIPQVVVSQRMAIRLSCSLGDSITINSFDNLQRMAIDFTAIPQSRRFRISGIFATNNPDYDILFAYCPLQPAQAVLDLGNNISGYEIRLKNINDSEAFKNEFLSQFGNRVGLKVNTWYDLHKDLYNVMQIERWSAFILLSLIISVATFNILGSLTMSVIEKKRDIGVLRAMGVKINSIVKIFMFEGILVGFIGTITGLIVGLIICYLQIEFKLYALDPASYIIDAIPVKLETADIIAVTAASLFLTFIASLYPAKRAAKINLIESIKYE